MDVSIFEVLGPVMIGPSSSHTAGAARLARTAALIVCRPFYKVVFGLSGSLAKTGEGHGTQKALLAGAMGFAADDEAIRDIRAHAAAKGVEAEYTQEDLDWLHENAVHITFHHPEGGTSEVWGASVGGGRICVRRIGDIEMEISAEKPTLVLPHLDRPGVVSAVSRLLADSGLNIAVMRMSRSVKGQQSILVMELDDSPAPEVVRALREVKHVAEVILIDLPQF